MPAGGGAARRRVATVQGCRGMKAAMWEKRVGLVVDFRLLFSTLEPQEVEQYYRTGRKRTKSRRHPPLPRWTPLSGGGCRRRC